MKNTLLLIGAGGLGREVAWQMSQAGADYKIRGFIDDAPALQNTTVNGLPVLGGIDDLARYREPVSAVICIGSARIRQSVAERLSANPLITFPTVIAPGVRHSDTVRFGRGCVICLLSILTVDITVGDFVVVSPNCTVGHDAVLEDFVTLYPGVNVSGNVRISACAEIGTGAQIIQGKKIGTHSIVGAGAVVVRDIPEHCTAVGVPAVPIKAHA